MTRIRFVNFPISFIPFTHWGICFQIRNIFSPVCPPLFSNSSSKYQLYDVFIVQISIILQKSLVLHTILTCYLGLFFDLANFFSQDLYHDVVPVNIANQLYRLIYPYTCQCNPVPFGMNIYFKRYSSKLIIRNFVYYTTLYLCMTIKIKYAYMTLIHFF
jgi:hypothetical protein